MTAAVFTLPRQTVRTSWFREDTHLSNLNAKKRRAERKKLLFRIGAIILAALMVGGTLYSAFAIFFMNSYAAYDEYAIRIGDTAIYQYYEALQVLPADTLIVFTRSYFMGASSNAETYAKFQSLYRAIVEFQAP